MRSRERSVDPARVRRARERVLRAVQQQHGDVDVMRGPDRVDLVHVDSGDGARIANGPADPGRRDDPGYLIPNDLLHRREARDRDHPDDALVFRRRLQRDGGAERVPDYDHLAAAEPVDGAADVALLVVTECRVFAGRLPVGAAIVREYVVPAAH